MLKRFFKNFIAFLGGCAVAFIIGECTLRIYDPYVLRVRGDKIVLPANVTYVYKNPNIPHLDKTIFHSKNGLGFRGPEKPIDFQKYFSIIAIGGSTTECEYLSDGHDWPSILYRLMQKDIPQVWVNNAGLGGHSTFGHQILMEDVIAKIKPNLVLLLVGFNDIGRDDLSKDDKRMLRYRGQYWKSWLVNNFEVFALTYNLKLRFSATSRGFGENLNGMQLSDTLHFSSQQEDSVKKANTVFVVAYGNRLRTLIKIARNNGSEPFFCTQPMLWGASVDPVSGRYLGNIKVHGMPSRMEWDIMEMYNAQLRKVCNEKHVFLVDLAKRLPKSSLYFYDEVHFTNEGAQKVGEIIYQQLVPQLKVLMEKKNVPVSLSAGG